MKVLAETAHRARPALRYLGLLWLAGLSLRLTVLAVPPLLPQIHQSLGLDETALSALTTLPVLLMAAMAPAGSAVTVRLGPKGTLRIGLVVVAVAAALRGTGGVATLFGLTFVMSAAIAAVQPAMPALVKQWAPRWVGLATATYVNGLLAGELIAASLMLPAILPLTGTWPTALAAWSLPVAATAALLGVPRRRTSQRAPSAAAPPAEPAAGEPAEGAARDAAGRWASEPAAGGAGTARGWPGDAAGLPGNGAEDLAGNRAEDHTGTRAEVRAGNGAGGRAGTARWWPDWRNGRTWRLGLLQGAGSAAYFGTNAFLPTYLHAIGHPGLVGAGLTALNAAQIPASFLLAALPPRRTTSAPAIAVLAVIILTGVPLVLSGNPAAILAGAILLGFTSSSMLITALTLPALLESPEEAPRLSAGMFVIGYGLAFLLPLVGGAAWDGSGVPAAAFAPILAGAVGLLALVPALRRDRAPVAEGAG